MLLVLLSLLACTCTGAADQPPAPESPSVTPPDIKPLPEAHRPLCEQPLACGLLVHHPIDVVAASVCTWCGETSPGLCPTWLPAAPGESGLPRCTIYRELERCVMQQSGVTRFGDLSDIARDNVLTLQDREDQKTDCVE